MRDQENQESSEKNSFEIDTRGLTAHELPSTLGTEVMVGGGQSAAAASPVAAAGSPSPEVILVSESDPMTDLGGKVQWFEPFEVRRRKGFLEITVRIIQGTVALFFSLVALTILVAPCIRLVKGGQQVFQKDQVFLFVFLASVILPLATVMVFVTARRLRLLEGEPDGDRPVLLRVQDLEPALEGDCLSPARSGRDSFLALPFFYPDCGGAVSTDRAGRSARAKTKGQPVGEEWGPPRCDSSAFPESHRSGSTSSNLLECNPKGAGHPLTPGPGSSPASPVHP